MLLLTDSRQRRAKMVGGQEKETLHCLHIYSFCILNQVNILAVQKCFKLELIKLLLYIP